VEDEAVLNNVHKKEKIQNPPFTFRADSVIIQSSNNDFALVSLVSMAPMSPLADEANKCGGCSESVLNS
jgi:hypothetical protein